MNCTRAWVTCDHWNEGHWEDDNCKNPVLVHAKMPKVYDTLLKCVVNEAAPPVPGQGAKI